MLSSILSTSAPRSGTFDCQNPPASLRKLGVRGRRGLLMVFVPPGAHFERVNTAWQALAGEGLTVLALSSTGALCSSKGRSA